ncbi:MAG: polymerase subunit gamma/tau, partial [Pseudonocardiales bacterium]|nr:polymerase subunit gamma/tau [Pseudonocardiales bacterium]
KARADAVEAVRDLERQRETGSVRSPGRVSTVGEWLAYWVENIAAASVRENTLSGYRVAVNVHPIPGVGAHRLDRLEPEHLERLYVKMIRSGSSPGTAHQAHRTIRTALGEAERRGRIIRNPAQLAKAPRLEEIGVEPYSVDEVRQLLKAAADRCNGVRWAIALALGLRQGEVLGLRWADVDMDGGTFWVRRGRLRPRYSHGCGGTCGKSAGYCPKRVLARAETNDTKSRAGRRAVGLPAELVVLLVRHREEQARERTKAEQLWRDSGYVFTTPLGEPVNPSTDYHQWKRLLADAGLRDGRLHDARHTAATALLILGVPERAVMSLMGWSTTAMAARYQHVTGTVRGDVAERVGGLIWARRAPNEPGTETARVLPAGPHRGQPGVCAGQCGGGWGIRTPEGLHPTRFPSVRHRPLGESSNAAEHSRVTGGGDDGLHSTTGPARRPSCELPQGRKAARVNGLWRVRGVRFRLPAPVLSVPMGSLADVALALYRKYRPAKFAEVVGQEHVTDPLRTALESGRINHAYLFSGPRGCGKTSSARILARSLNCEQGPTPEPCGVCSSCVSLAPGGPGNIDVTELDAASHGGVDDTRELRDRAFFAPAESRYRVFIVDEAHMITTQGFNALLKIVEEPPEHLVFVFATTEPEKVLPTIRSRTHHYPFRLIPPGTLRKLLERICAEEGVAVAPAVYPLVIRAGGGSARDSLSVLDQLVSGAGPEGVTYDRAVALLGVTDVSLIDDVVDALAAGDRAAVFEAIDRLVEAGHDPRRFATDLLQRLRDLTLLQAVPEAVGRGIVEAADDEVRRMVEQSAKFGAATLTRYGEILHTGLTEMRGATAPRLLLELLCARMLLPAATTAEPGLLERLERLERRSDIASGPPAPGEAGDDTGHSRQFDRPSTRAPGAPTTSAGAASSTSARGGPAERGGEPQAGPREPAAAAEHGGLVVVTRESGVAAAA